MAVTTAFGTVPSPPDLSMVPGLFYERFGQRAQHQVAQEIAPLVEMELLKGSYPIDNSGAVGVDLAQDPRALTPRAWAGTDRVDQPISLASRDFEINSWDLGKYLIGDLDRAHLQATSKIDIDSIVANHYAIRGADKHATLIYQTVSASGSYAAGHTANVSLGGPTGDIISAFIAYQATLADSGVDASLPTYLLATPATLAFIRKLDQVKSHFNAPNSNFVDEAALSDILSGIAGIEIRVRGVGHRYGLANGTRGYSFAANSIALVHAAGGLESSFLKTLHASGKSGMPVLLHTETERNIDALAWEITGTGFWTAHSADQKAGVLWTNVDVDPDA